MLVFTNLPIKGVSKLSAHVVFPSHGNILFLFNQRVCQKHIVSANEDVWETFLSNLW